MPSVFFCISGHGFGHSSRQIAIVNALLSAAPDARVVIRTSAPRWLFERSIRGPFTYVEGITDTGVVQIDSLHLDERQTIQRAAEFHRELPARAIAEAAVLREHDARFVISDAPPLACAAAAVAKIPSVVISNFTWDWIYEGYAEQLSSAPDLIPLIQEAYGRAEAAWRLPMHGGFTTFDTIVDLPLVARHATHDRVIVRTQLALPCDVPVVLSSFGGYGVQELDPGRLDCLETYAVVMTTAESRGMRRKARRAPDFDTGSGPGLYVLDENAIYECGFRYEDLVAATDVVATKPGYGIISECIANHAAILYTSRGRFVEYDALVREMPRYLRSQYIEMDDLLAGRWRAALDALVASPPPPERPRADGAQVAARMIVERMQI